MGDGLIPDPHEVVYEDDDVRISLVRSDQYARLADVARVEPSPDQHAFWEGQGVHPSLHQEVSVTLSAHQWAGVLAAIRASMSITPQPGTMRLMHDAIYAQLPIQRKAEE